MKKPKNKNTKAYANWELKKLKIKALKLWKEVVKLQAGGKCEITGCGETKGCQCHHILDFKLFKTLRYSPDNGVYCEPRHHKFSKNSFHKNPIFAYEFLLNYRTGSLANLKCWQNDEEPAVTKEWLIEQIERLDKLKREYSFNKYVPEFQDSTGDG